MNTTYQRSRKKIAAATLALAATFAFAQLAGAASYTWNVTSGNWSDLNSWTPAPGAGGPLAADTVIFGNNNASADSVTVNNTVDAGFAGTVAGLTYNSTLSTAFNVTQIPVGETLTIAGPVLVGGISGNPITTQASFTGGGNLLVTGNSLMVQNYGSSSANSIATLNLAGLGTFTYSNSVGTISVEDNVGSFTRAGGSLILAATNFITATNLNLGTDTAAQAGAGGQQMVLGLGTNVINVANFNISAQKNNYSVTNTGGSLRIRGLSGADTDRASIIVGNKNVGGGSGTITGNFFLNGCAVDIKASTLVVGENIGGAPNSSGDNGIGLMQFDTGTVDANGVAIGLNSSANFSATVFAATTGTLTVSTNATLVVGSGGISIASQSSSGPATGTLNIVGSTVICNGSITTATNATSTSTINFVTGGKLVMGPNSSVGTPASPLTTLNLIEGTTLEFGAPLAEQTNIVAKNIVWPVNDSLLTITLDGPPATATNGIVIPLISFAASTGGTFTAPVLHLPAGITGNLTEVSNTVYLTITGGIVPGVGGLNQLNNGGLELLPAKAGWTATGNTPLIMVGGATYYNQGACGSDPTPQLVISHSGTNVGNIYGNFTGGANTSSYSQAVTVIAGDTFAAGGYTLVSHEDMMSGANSFYYRVNFLDSNSNLLASYQSYTVSNLTCGETTPFALDNWNFLGVTNQMKVAGGVNTGVVLSTNVSGIITAPPNSATATFAVVFVQQGPPDQYDGGSVYFDDLNFGFFSGPIPPTVSAVTPNLVAFATNTTLTCTAASSKSTISSVQVIVTSRHLGFAATTVTNTATSPGVTVTGLGTASIGVSYALATNTVYSSVVVKVTDANGNSSSSSGSLDTLTPTLVIEAADFNFQNGGFLDTPPNGGFALYTNRVGVQGVDENKATRVAVTSYYRTNDAVVIQAAVPSSGNSSTEQKFITSAANGDTTNVELEVGYNTPGDWVNYTRTYGGSGSAPAGTYNIYCYLATSGTGTQSTFSQVTTDPTQGNQTTNFLGYFGTSTFTDNGYNTFVYVPLTDQFGNPVAVTIAAGQQTFKNTVVGNPNIAFYMLVPVVPVLTPVLQNVYPNGATPYQTSGTFTFTVGPANGAAINTNGIGLTLNGISVSSGLNFTQVGNSWTATYNIQSNQLYTAVISVTNANGLSSSYSVQFDSFDLNAYQWEAVDYDFTLNGVSAQFIDNSVPTCFTNDAQDGIIAPNSYFGYPGGNTTAASTDGLGALAKQGVDINFPDLQPNVGTTPNPNSTYRADTVGAQAATDFLRPKFTNAQVAFAGQISGKTIGPVNIGYFDGGSWLNYTRTWPTNNFYVWGRLAGGAGAFSGTTLSRVTSGVGTSNQTLQVLGSFSDPNASGWQTYHWVQLLDTNGNPAVVSLGGVSTLRVTSGNNLNAEFFLLSPATANLTKPFNVSVSVASNQAQLSITTQAGHNYTVYYANSLPATSWTQVGSTNISITDSLPVHIVTVPATGGQGYYRVTSQ